MMRASDTLADSRVQKPKNFLAFFSRLLPPPPPPPPPHKKKNKNFFWIFFCGWGRGGGGEEAQGKCKEIFCFLHTRVRERVRGAHHWSSGFNSKYIRTSFNTHGQLGNEVIGSPATRARQPFFGEISSRFEFSKAKSGLFLKELRFLKS